VKWSARPLTVPDREPILVHVIEGQHFASFDSNSQRAFFDTVWSVAPDSNRMGFRLSGPPLGRPEADEILSGPTCLGSVQVPPSGVPIALMADHQTTGGYPRIAEIASADVARLAQLAPGGKVHFARCSLEMAGELRKHARERLQSALRGIAWEYAKK
jgi:antagonist of KipI